MRFRGTMVYVKKYIGELYPFLPQKGAFLPAEIGFFGAFCRLSNKLWKFILGGMNLEEKELDIRAFGGDHGPVYADNDRCSCSCGGWDP